MNTPQRSVVLLEELIEQLWFCRVSPVWVSAQDFFGDQSAGGEADLFEGIVERVTARRVIRATHAKRGDGLGVIHQHRLGVATPGFVLAFLGFEARALAFSHDLDLDAAPCKSVAGETGTSSFGGMLGGFTRSILI